MDYFGWCSIAERRVLSVLKTYGACTERQLQLKIAEAGPYNQRVEVIILTKVIRDLVKSGKILSDALFNGNQKIYYLSTVNGEFLKNRKANLTEWYEIYNKYAQNNSYTYCGNILENMISNAIRETEKYDYISTVFEVKEDGVISKGPCALNAYNGNYTENPLDCIAIIKGNGIPLGIEIKNKNEWKYGSDKEIWKFIKKCCELEVLPLFIARKIPAITKFFFYKAGIIGMETQFQYLHPYCKEELGNLIKKDKLGYAHIKFETNHRKFMSQYFDTVVIKNSTLYFERFKQNRDLLHFYSLKLSKDKLSDRNDIYKDVRDKIYERYENEIEIEDIDLGDIELYEVDNIL